MSTTLKKMLQPLSAATHPDTDWVERSKVDTKLHYNLFSQDRAMTAVQRLLQYNIRTDCSHSTVTLVPGKYKQQVPSPRIAEVQTE